MKTPKVAFEFYIGQTPNFVSISNPRIKTEGGKPIRVSLSQMDDEFVDAYIEAWTSKFRADLEARRLEDKQKPSFLERK